ncbi:hypothetical protein [Rhodococcus rhodochrous]|uniref:Uncharacterized protein n=1 Tax=Rhodococcus rhodochrous KG-21 TaxID=1441923 RepID=A0A0M8PKF8_RHORH|nr:hypothetical protein [Rhodococcus rhodochrous]KOS54512.1 hypothetical protein Z051_19695 [Rhodococcus rhodochrous KG-21]
MKLHARNLNPGVTVDGTATRPVLLRVAGLVLAVTPGEALALADQLHDAAEEIDSAERTSR